MHYVNKMTISATVVSATLLFAVFAVGIQPALAKQPQKLKGTYGVTGAGGCLQSNSGFNADLTPVNPATGNVAVSQTVGGTFTFNDDGTGTRSGTVISIVEPPTPLQSASESSFSGTFTYTVNVDGTISFQTNAPTTGTFTAGPRTGQTFSVDEIELTGHVSKDGSAIVLATTNAGVETISFSNGDSVDRVCSRSRVLTEL